MLVTRRIQNMQALLLLLIVIATGGCSQKPVADSGDGERGTTSSAGIATKDKTSASASDKKEKLVVRDTPRKIAEWILSVNGRLMLKGSDQWIEKFDELPPEGQFTLGKVWLWRSENGADAIQPEDILSIVKLTELEELTLRGQKIGDRMIHELSELKKLKLLNIHNCGISDESFPSLAKLKQLRVLDVGYSHRKITDKGVASLAELRELKNLCLFASAITDDSLKILATLPHLKYVEVKRTDVTERGIEYLKSALPDCKVN